MHTTTVVSRYSEGHVVSRPDMLSSIFSTGPIDCGSSATPEANFFVSGLLAPRHIILSH
jgi:hypothetical protein